LARKIQQDANIFFAIPDVTSRGSFRTPEHGRLAEIISSNQDRLFTEIGKIADVEPVGK
jgi:hypothetical protein